MIARLVLLIGILFFAMPAQADEFLPMTFVNILHTLVRFNAIDVSDDLLMDDYALVTACDLLEDFYSNEFQWTKVRDIIRESIKVNIAAFPTSFYYDARVQLDRYDFASQTYRFTPKSLITGVNSFSVNYENKEKTLCGRRSLKYLPTYYTTVIGSPITITGLPFAETDAQALLKRLNEEGNPNRIIYARFNMRIISIEPFRRSNVLSETPTYMQANAFAHQMRLDARLESVDFYEDEARTKLVYSYTP